MAVAVSSQSIVDSLQGVMTGLYWQGRVLRAMGYWMGAHEPQDWRIGEWWVAVHGIHIRAREVEVEWELLRCDLNGDADEIDAGTTTQTRPDTDGCDVTDAAWWEGLHQALVAEAEAVGAQWQAVTVQMAARRWQCIEWEVAR